MLACSRIRVRIQPGASYAYLSWRPIFLVSVLSKQKRIMEGQEKPWVPSFVPLPPGAISAIWNHTRNIGRPRSIGRSSPPRASTPPTRALPPCPARTPIDRFPPIYTPSRQSQRHMQKKTNANPPAISSARAQKPAAVSSSSASPTNNSTVDVALPEFEPKVPSPPPPFASDRWAAGGASSSDEEEDVKKTTKKPAAASKGAPAKKSTKPKGKDKYLAEKADQDFMPGGAPNFDDDDELPLSSFDPFADEAAASGASAGAGDDGRVHLRVQQRNGKKTLTTVQGLSTGYNYAKVLRDLKRELCCNGTVVEDKELGNVIQLQGDHRKKVATFLAKAGLAKTDCIKVHGF